MTENEEYTIHNDYAKINKAINELAELPVRTGGLEAVPFNAIAYDLLDECVGPDQYFEAKVAGYYTFMANFIEPSNGSGNVWISFWKNANQEQLSRT